MHYFILWFISIVHFHSLCPVHRKQREGGVEGAWHWFLRASLPCQERDRDISLCGTLTPFLVACSWAVKQAVSGTTLTYPSQYTPLPWYKSQTEDTGKLTENRCLMGWMKMELRRATALCSKQKGERLDTPQISDSQGNKTKHLGLRNSMQI